MLRIEPVLLPESHTLNCLACDSILFEINLIEAFLQPYRVQTVTEQYLQNNRYLVLSAKTTPSSLKINEKIYLCKEKPFYMIHVSDVLCQQCESNLGLRPETVTSQMPAYEIHRRVLINGSRVKVIVEGEDITKQLLKQFECDELKEQISFGEQTSKTNLKKDKGNNPPDTGSQQRIKINGFNMKKMRESLQQQREGDREIINQILSTIDFFTQALDSLQRRVCETENVCAVLKNKVEAIVPILRKH